MQITKYWGYIAELGLLNTKLTTGTNDMFYLSNKFKY